GLEVAAVALGGVLERGSVEVQVMPTDKVRNRACRHGLSGACCGRGAPVVYLCVSVCGTATLKVPQTWQKPAAAPVGILCGAARSPRLSSSSSAAVSRLTR